MEQTDGVNACVDHMSLMGGRRETYRRHQTFAWVSSVTYLLKERPLHPVNTRCAVRPLEDWVLIVVMLRQNFRFLPASGQALTTPEPEAKRCSLLGIEPRT